MMTTYFLFIVLAFVTTAWCLAQTGNPGGNSTCAQWCAANFAPTPGANCTCLAANGKGPCYVCGPRSSNPHEKLCGGVCSDTSSDSNNCGACGNVCITGSTCSSSACVCTNSDKLPCNEQCQELTPHNNCSTRGHSCPSNNTCQPGTCVAPPANCTTYTASCSDVINGVLASNSIASPQLVDYRIQSAILGIISPADFLAALGANPCDGLFTDSSERATCVDLLSKPDFVAELTDIVKVVLTSLQTCATDFADGGSAAPITITDPTCPAPPTVRRNVQKRYEIDLTASILADIEHYRSTAVASALGPKKMSSRSLDLIALSRRQADTCANTEQCFERCPGCRDAQTYCGTTVIDMTTEICNAVSFTAGPIVGTVSAAVCGAACGPVAAFCAGICGTLAGGAAQRAVDKTCAVSMAAICDQLRKRCANCNNSNNDICNPDSTQCCPGETGTDCGQGCCCCPECQAPGGINCACTDAPC